MIVHQTVTYIEEVGDMKKIIRLTESDLYSIVKNVINESLNTIQLQLISGYFYPIDAISRGVLENEFNLGRIPEDKIDVWSPKLVRMGYKLAISDYNPTPKNNKVHSYGGKIGGDIKPQKDPCKKCGFNGLCDSDDCGKKGFRLFAKK